MDDPGWIARNGRWLAFLAVVLGVLGLIGQPALGVMASHWFLFALIAIVILGMTGIVGRGLGLQNIFHEDPELWGRYGAEHGLDVFRNSPAFYAQAAVAGALVYFWGFAFTLVEGEAAMAARIAGGAHTARDLAGFAPELVRAVALTTLISLYCGCFRVTTAVGPLQRLEWLRAALGVVAGLIYATGMFGVALIFHEWFFTGFAHGPTYALMVPAAVSTALILRYRKLLPVVSLTSLLTVVAMAYAMISSLDEGWELVAVIGAVIVIGIVNGIGPKLLKVPELKFSLPGIVDAEGRSHYERGNRLDLGPIYGVNGASAGSAASPAPAPASAAPATALGSAIEAMIGTGAGGGQSEAEGMTRMNRQVALRERMAETEAAQRQADEDLPLGADASAARGRLDPEVALVNWLARAPRLPDRLPEPLEPGRLLPALADEAGAADVAGRINAALAALARARRRGSPAEGPDDAGPGDAGPGDEGLGEPANQPAAAAAAPSDAARAGKPKMVIVCTSGGAYRASFWTGIVLDTLTELDRAGVLPGFCANTRLITGASGGMVGGAYFAVMMGESGYPEKPVCAAIEDDVLAAQTPGHAASAGYPYKTPYPIPRDSLSPVAQQLVQRDLPGLFSPLIPRTDRGRVLEDQWLTLNARFGSLKHGEEEGWRPSLIFSPMLVETGQPLLISNLDMDKIRRDKLGETVQFFEWFPHSRATFRVKTAVRLNAAFPYVSPSTALPTDPYRRVVDAGYYDNYGIDLAATYLSKPRTKEWLIENTSGVVVVEIRAFPFEPPSVSQPNPFLRGMQWLTTPLEGVLAARGSTMTFRNRQSLRQVRVRYAETKASDTAAAGGGMSEPAIDALRAEWGDFITPVTFEVDSDTSLNWYLPERELTAMRRKFAHELNLMSLERLVRAWWR